jgi:hypothetical protein
MAEAHTTDQLVLPADRQHLGMEAAWELDALRTMVADLCGDLGAQDADQAALMQLRLKVRGLTIRMGQLAGVLMSVLGDDDTTADLYRKVHGRSFVYEVAHG